MIPLFDVVDGGLAATIQDLGRPGFRRVGVPVSGPLDRVALRLANALVGNSEQAPALEMLYRGPTLRAVAPHVRVAIVGAEAEVVHESGDRHPVPSGRSARLKAGERLAVRAFDARACAYLAVEGGFAVESRLGSAATCRPGAFGGFVGRALTTGDRLPGRTEDAPERPERALAAPLDAGLDRPVRVVLGPQDDRFTEDGLKTFLSADYAVSRQADRMGLRLDGPAIAHARGHDLVSDGTVSGSIQVPGDGRPIVLAADAQTSGGYPKIATVISADLPLLFRRRPGDAVRFVAVTRRQAEVARATHEQEVAHAISAIREVADQARLDPGLLYSANLIGGVVAASHDDEDAQPR